MDLGRSWTRTLVAAAAGWTALAGLSGGTRAHACCNAPVEGRYFDVQRPRNTLVWVWRDGDRASLRRIAPERPHGRMRWGESIPMTGLGAGDLWRPTRLLEVGGEYEVVVGDQVRSRFLVEGDVDHSPPDFGGVEAVTLRRHSQAFSGDDPPGREILIVHDPLPPDVAFIVVSLRRYGAGETSRRVLGLRPDAMGERRDRTVLSSSCGTDHPPPFAVGATYCVSIAAHDAAGNASGGDVEVCSPVIDCRNPSWRQVLECPLPYGTLMPADVPDEIALKDVTVPSWPTMCARALSLLVVTLVLLVAWRWRSRRSPRWAP